MNTGSSPLARGLRANPYILIATARIIPARAGFTNRKRLVLVQQPDHPRSRGVYGGLLRIYTDDSGSSPLARGLPRATDAAREITRIIPARAGFTHPQGPYDRGRRDHPRSRGVYPLTVTWCTRWTGSSPLARGLHLRILRIPTMSHTTRLRLPSLTT